MNIELIKYKYFLIKHTGISEENADDVFKRWTESWRFYHTEEHLLNFLKSLENHKNIPLNILDNMLVAAIFHDVVYLPCGKENERLSADLMLEYCSKLDKKILSEIENFIMITTHTEMPIDDEYLKIFWCIDNDILLQPSIDKLMNYEIQIRKEFQFIDYSIYKEKRLEFLQNWVTHNIKHIGQNCIYKLDMLGSFIKNYKPNIGVFCGSFNPLHIGHMNIIEKAEKIFDKVIIVLERNAEKSIYNNEKLLKNVKDIVVYRQVDMIDGLLSDYLESKQKNVDIFLIKGLRNEKDLIYEQQQLWFINQISNVNVVCFLCDEKYKYISSSDIRNLQKNKDKKIKNYIKTLLPNVK